MKLAAALMLMTTCLAAGSAMPAAAQVLPLRPDVSLTSGAAPGAAPTLIEDNGDEGEGGWFWSLSDDDDDEDDDESDDDDDCEDDDDGGDDCASGTAPAGVVAPPKNGLFTDGTAPVVKSN